MAGRQLRQQHPSDLLSGGDVPRVQLNQGERSSRDVPAGQQIMMVLLT